MLVVWDNPGISRDPVPSDIVLSRIPERASGRDGTNLYIFEMGRRNVFTTVVTSPPKQAQAA
eukprot:scaffold15499_cov152-Skeletonema_marinoi.AAC.1